MSGITAPGTFGYARRVEDRERRPVETRPRTPAKTTVRVAGKSALEQTIEIPPRIITLDMRHGDKSKPLGGLVSARELVALGSLWKAVEFDPRTQQAWGTQLRDTPRALVVEHDTTLVGFARMTQEGTTAIFRDGAVAPDYQGLGIFSAMVRRGVQEARLLGCQAIRLDPAPGTESMYQHLGWTEAEL